MTDQDINLSDDSKDRNKEENISTDDGAQGRGGTQPSDPMIAITNAMQSDPSRLMLIILEFEVAAAHLFVIQ